MRELLWAELAEKNNTEVTFQSAIIRAGVRERNPRRGKPQGDSAVLGPSFWQAWRATQHQAPASSNIGCNTRDQEQSMLGWGSWPKYKVQLSTSCLRFHIVLSRLDKKSVSVGVSRPFATMWLCSTEREYWESRDRNTSLTRGHSHRLYKAKIFSSNKTAEDWVVNVETNSSISRSLPSSGLQPAGLPAFLRGHCSVPGTPFRPSHQTSENRIHGFISCSFTGATEYANG